MIYAWCKVRGDQNYNRYATFADDPAFDLFMELVDGVGPKWDELEAIPHARRSTPITVALLRTCPADPAGRKEFFLGKLPAEGYFSQT